MRVKRNMIAVENSSIFKRGLDSLALHIKAFNEEGRKNINGSFCISDLISVRLCNFKDGVS